MVVAAGKQEHGDVEVGEGEEERVVVECIDVVAAEDEDDPAEDEDGAGEVVGEGGEVVGREVGSRGDGDPAGRGGEAGEEVARTLRG